MPSNSFFDDFWTKDVFDFPAWNTEGTVPRVNILETNEDFRVEVAAPGMNKEDFHLELDNDMLVIHSELTHKNESSDDKRYTRREFNYHSFKRTFYLPNTVESDKIEAVYKNGILSLVIPKKEEAKKKPVKTIKIS